jgi:DNA-binding PadR family transcriptional regulator
MGEVAATRKRGEKAMTSAVNWALLGLVIDRSSYGLELAHRFERVYADVLPVSSESHIYAALDALKVRGMIEIVPGTELVRQPKLHYQATPFGSRSYEEWVVTQIDEERRRQELWVRQLAIFAHDPDAALRMIGRFERRYQDGAGKIGHSPATSSATSRVELIDELVAEQRRLAAGAMLSWFQFAYERFEVRGVASPSHDSPRA